MEYPALVAGRPSALMVHLTDASNTNGFKPVARGKVTALLRYPDGKEESFVADKLLREGIFKPVVTPTRPGDPILVVKLEGDTTEGIIEVGHVRVHATTVDAVTAGRAEHRVDETELPFSKEQQWKTRFATAPAAVRVLQGSVRANGELKTVPGRAAELATPVTALVPPDARVPHLGQIVKKGEVLLSLSPTTVVSGNTLPALDLEVNRARLELSLAERDLKRTQELFASQAIPQKQVDAARTAREVAGAKAEAAARERGIYRSAQTGSGARGPGAFQLRSPLNGVVSFANVTPGSVAEAGTRLLAVVNTERLWLEAKVYEADAPRVERSSGASFTVAGFDEEFMIVTESGNARRVAVGAVIDRATRTVPVIFEFPNFDGRLKPGMFAKVSLLTGEGVRGVAVPVSALVDDNGRPVVFVVASGETFYKRVIRLGVRSGGLVQVLDGVREGERVVSRGAYELKLSIATGAVPERDHQH